eukprot:TRINITY_DN298_c0_g5_i1.p1 TRINITY_DN298_c0_g5~~TRINITY_DN298_c0_g5_i1.p1  ORF type:complete len:394 (+),score=194.40 TRINITY_DN298_c0_g5_i1:85-1266(+)
MPSKKKGGRKKKAAEGEAGKEGDAAATTETKKKQPKPKGPKAKPKEIAFLKDINPRWLAEDDTERRKFKVSRLSLGKPQPAVIPIARKVKGKGDKLKNIERIAANIKHLPKKDATLAALHRLVIGKVAKGVEVKDNLESFNGVVYDDDEFPKEKLVAKIEKMNLRMLRRVCDVLALDSEGTRDELSESLIKFLAKPTDLGRSPRKAPRSPTKSKGRSSPTKKRKTTKGGKVKRPLSAYMFFCADKREAIVKKHPDWAVTDVAKKLGAMWHKVGKEEAKPYQKQADKDKTRYKEELKKLEKKKKKAASSSEESGSEESGSESGGEVEKDDKKKEKKDVKGKEKDKKEKEENKKEKDKDKKKDDDGKKEKDKKGEDSKVEEEEDSKVEEEKMDDE